MYNILSIGKATVFVMPCLMGGLPWFHHLSRCCMGISKSQEQLLEMEEIGKVPVLGKNLISSITLTVPVYRKLFRIREPPVPVSSKMGSF